MTDPRWGERRTATRQRARWRWIAGLVVVLLASPFVLDFGARQYWLAGGALPGGRFPLWIPLVYWALVVGIAAFGVAHLFRLSDEFQRRRLIEGFAAAGLLLGLSIPPAYAMGLRHGFMFLWLGALVAGFVVMALRRSAT